MTLHLILTRHAKSDWDDPKLDDHDRPLNPRGTVSAVAMGQWLARQGHVPAQALVSTATRAMQTWEGMRPALPGCAASFHPHLYHAAPETILSVLAGAGAHTTLVIGHNPGFAMLAEALVKRPPDHPQFFGYPTCATLILEAKIDIWADLRPGMAKVLAFAVPREVISGPD